MTGRGGAAPAPPRVLILSASIGEGHDLPARALAENLAGDALPEVVDVLPVLGRPVETVAATGMRATFGAGRLNWVFDAEYFVFSRFAPTRSLGQAALSALTAARLHDEIERRGADVVVTTYPIAAEVLGRLRADGRLQIPVCSAITDLAAFRYWAHPGIDLHLVTHPESVAEVERIAGLGSARAVNGLTSSRFLSPPQEEEARALLGLPRTAVVTISGGGWGVGDLAGAVHTALAVPETTVVCLCGRNDSLRRRLETAFGLEERVRVLGFVDDMATLLTATDVLVHSTAGLTVLEAHMLGCRVISYGWGVGHVRINNRAFRRFGIAEVAGSRRRLREAIRRGLAAPRTPRLDTFAALPAAGTLVLDLAAPAGGLESP